MSSSLAFAVFYVGPVLLSFLTGTRFGGWTVLVWPAVCLALGALWVVLEPPGYDMHGYGLFVGAVLALVAGVAWLLGRAAAAGGVRR